MRPNDIGEIPGKIRVLPGGKPFREDLAAGLILYLRRIATEEFWRHRLARHRMLDLALALVKDDGLAWILTRLPPDLREERSEAVIIVHRPAIERVVMALGALDAHAHENLRG